MPFLEPVTLRGAIVTLEPLSEDHHDGLVTASQDGRLSKLWYTSVPDPLAMREEIARRLGLLAEQRMLPFAVRRNDTAAICGMTTYTHADAANKRVEIGSTWTAASSQRTGVNTRASCFSSTPSRSWAASRSSSGPIGSITPPGRR